MNPGLTPKPRYSVALLRGEAGIVGAKKVPDRNSATLRRCLIPPIVSVAGIRRNLWSLCSERHTPDAHTILRDLIACSIARID